MSLAITGVLIALLTTGVMPIVSLALAPLLVGVPHLAADLRYLVLRPRWPPGPLALLLTFGPLVAFAYFNAPWVGFCASIGAAALGTGSIGRRAAVAAMALLLAASAAIWPAMARFLVAHGHNLVAVALWWSWRAGSWRRVAPLALFVVAYAAILLGGLDAVGLGHGFGGVRVSRLIHQLAPGFQDPWQRRLVLSFCFAQAVHYGIWLRWIPEDDRERRTPRPFLASWRAACADFGIDGAVLFVALTLGFMAWAAINLPSARDGYLRLAAFHGYLEFAAIGGMLSAARSHVARR